MRVRMSIINGDCLKVMSKMEDNSISAIVTDPPYGLKFMGKDWDRGIPGIPFWNEALRISKPGTFLLAFGGTRMYHRLTCAIEDAGWEIRDCLQWIYGGGFPKSHNHFGLEGYGTALKPAYEPIIMAMKPNEGTFKQNVEKWEQAGINIDESRIPLNEKIDDVRLGGKGSWDTKSAGEKIYNGGFRGDRISSSPKGRWPANVILDEEAAKQLDEQSGVLKSGAGDKHSKTQTKSFSGGLKCVSGLNVYDADSGGASRFFYCAKASPSERGTENNHPTVKPLKLMKYLIKLLMPPKDGILLDPFAGSGSTIVAAHELGLKAIGIEKNEEYVEIAKTRINNIEKDFFVKCI